MRIRFLGTSALMALAACWPALADSRSGLQAAQRSADMGNVAAFLADQADRKIHADWHNGISDKGLAASAEAGQVWHSRKGRSDQASSASHMLGSSLGLSYSDGDSWALSLTGTRLDGRTQFGTSGSHDLSGYGLTVSGVNSFGDFVLGTHSSFTWLNFDHAVRKTGVADVSAKKSGGYVENFGVEAGYRLGGKDWSLIPSVGIQHDDVTMDRFSETGTLALSFSKGGYKGWKSHAGFSAEVGRLVFSEIEIRPTVDVRYERWLGARQIKVTGSDNTAASFTTLAAMSGRNTVTVRPELDISFGGALHLNASYLYRWQRNAKEQGLWLRLALQPG